MTKEIVVEYAGDGREQTSVDGLTTKDRVYIFPRFIDAFREFRNGYSPRLHHQFDLLANVYFTHDANFTKAVYSRFIFTFE